MSVVKRVVRCEYCGERASLLNDAAARTKYPGWTRYGCSNGHRFALPTHQVEEKARREH